MTMPVTTSAERRETALVRLRRVLATVGGSTILATHRLLIYLSLAATVLVVALRRGEDGGVGWVRGRGWRSGFAGFFSGLLGQPGLDRGGGSAGVRYMEGGDGAVFAIDDGEAVLERDLVLAQHGGDGSAVLSGSGGDGLGLAGGAYVRMERGVRRTMRNRRWGV